MSVIDVQYPHALDKAASRAAIDAIAHGLIERYDLQSAGWSGDTLTVSRPGVDASLTLVERAVHVSIRLGALYVLLAPLVETEVRRQLRDHLG